MRLADYINALPDSYAKHTDSNNYKLLSMEYPLVAALREDIQAVQDTLDIRIATGKTLDLYGAIYGQSRGSMTDEQYRIIILQKAARCLAGCDYESVVNSLAVALGVSPSEFVLVEGDGEVTIDKLPLSALQNIGITSKQAWQIVKSMMPAGISLASMNLGGTFEFSAFADEYDELAGFGDIEQTIGGTLGALETGDIDIPE